MSQFGDILRIQSLAPITFCRSGRGNRAINDQQRHVDSQRTQVLRHRLSETPLCRLCCRETRGLGAASEGCGRSNEDDISGAFGLHRRDHPLRGDQSAQGRRRKHERDLRILHLDVQERPEHPFVLFNLGMTYADMGEHAQAVDWLRRSIEVAQPAESHLRKAYALLAASYDQLEEFGRAWTVCLDGLARFPDDPELLFRKGMLAHRVGRLREAEAAYRGVRA